MKIALQIALILFIVVITIVVLSSVFGRLFSGGGGITGGGGVAGIFVSRDAGKNWEPFGLIAEEGKNEKSVGTVDILDFQPHPENEDIFFIGSNGGGLLKSEDRGATWVVVRDSNGVLSEKAIVPKVALSAGDPDIMYIPAFQDNASMVLRSRDGGASFERIYLASTAGERAYALNVDYYNPNLVYMITDSGLFLKSFNGGDTWQFANKFTVSGKELVVSKKDDLYLLAFNGSIQKSVDQGETWTAISVGQPVPVRKNPNPFFGGSHTAALALFEIDANFTTTLYAGIGSSVFRSYDGGVNWEPLNLIIKAENVFVTAFAQDPKNPHILYVAAGPRIYKSFDNGASWTVYNVAETGKVLSKMFISEDDSETIFAVFNNGR